MVTTEPTAETDLLEGLVKTARKVRKDSLVKTDPLDTTETVVSTDPQDQLVTPVSKDAKVLMEIKAQSALTALGVTWVTQETAVHQDLTAAQVETVKTVLMVLLVCLGITAYQETLETSAHKDLPVWMDLLETQDDLDKLVLG